MCGAPIMLQDVEQICLIAFNFLASTEPELNMSLWMTEPQLHWSLVGDHDWSKYTLIFSMFSRRIIHCKCFYCLLLVTLYYFQFLAQIAGKMQQLRAEFRVV